MPLGRSWPVIELRAGAKKLQVRELKLRFFRGSRLAPRRRAINLCGNFRQEPNAHGSGYYI